MSAITMQIQATIDKIPAVGAASGAEALEFIDPPFQRVTYAELDALVNQTAGFLQSLGAIFLPFNLALWLDFLCSSSGK